MRRPMQTSMLSGKLRVFPFVQADGHPPGGDDRMGRCAGVLCVADEEGAKKSHISWQKP